MIAIEKLVIFVIFLVVLLVIISLLIGVTNPTAEQIVLQGKLRQCCVAYRGNDCLNPADIWCDEETKLDVIMTKLNMQKYEVDRFCNCE